MMLWYLVLGIKNLCSVRLLGPSDPLFLELGAGSWAIASWSEVATADHSYCGGSALLLEVKGTFESFELT
jgi:hypothetical protein